MLKPRFEKTYQIFPYRADFDDGRDNIGGIDLRFEPHRIDEITELKYLPKTKQAIYDINTQNTAIMTLGCALGELPNYWGGYVEFCFRPHIDTSGIDIMRLDELFFENLTRHENQAINLYMGNALISWEYHLAKVHEYEPQPIVAVFVGARSAHDLDLTLELLFRRLHQDFLYLLS